jgi:hypothetical protein
MNYLKFLNRNIELTLKLLRMKNKTFFSVSRTENEIQQKVIINVV